MYCFVLWRSAKHDNNPLTRPEDNKKPPPRPGRPETLDFPPVTLYTTANHFFRFASTKGQKRLLFYLLYIIVLIHRNRNLKQYDNDYEDDDDYEDADDDEDEDDARVSCRIPFAFNYIIDKTYFA